MFGFNDETMGQSISNLEGSQYEAAALAAPPDMTSNFENPPNNNTAAWIGYISMISVSTIFLALRAYSRFLARRLSVEDTLLVLGYVSCQ